MSTTEMLVAIIAAAVIVLALIAVGLGIMARRRRLRDRFGSEYERTVRAEDGRLSGERELRSREKRHAGLDLRELSWQDRERYTEQWRSLERRFVDEPGETVFEADRLVTEVMRERGYPAEGFEQRIKDLSVDHSTTLEHYRAAHDVGLRSRQGKATTEELRGAMVHYRTLFRELLDTSEGDSRHHRSTEHDAA
jgi:hypothetical protein